MSNCRHSFCEACIVAYVSTFMDNNESEKGVQCPVCKTINPAPKDKSNLPMWVKSLELTEDVMVEMKICSGESKGQKECDSCHAYGISIRASKICFHCFELFCLPCSMGRHSGTFYRTHTVVFLDAENKDSTMQENIEEFRILKEYSYCSSHGGYPIEYYCGQDECLCCAACVVMTHCKCGNVIPLRSVNLEKDAKLELEKNKSIIDNLSLFAKNLIRTIQESAQDMKMQIENVRKTLQDIRTKVNKLLDTLDEAIVEQTNAISKNVELVHEKKSEY